MSEQTEQSRQEHNEGVAERIEEIPAAEGADILEEMSAESAADVAEILDPNTAANILSEMDPTLAASVLTDMEGPEASVVLTAMDPDDRVDILEHIPRAKQIELLGEMPREDVDEVRRLQQYPPQTAGGIMTTQVTALDESFTVEQAVAELRRLSEENEQMFYVYVVDSRKHLVGVLSMRDLILAKPDRKLNQIMIPNVRAIPATMDQEQVAAFIRKFNYLAVPVVDDRNRLLGIITVDDIVDVLEQEATEDVQKMFGAGAEERLISPWHFSFRKRVWWLEFNLATAFLAAWVVTRFENVISLIPVLAGYQSIVSGMGGNAGAQTLAVAIRGIALGESAGNVIWRVLRKEFLVGLLTGVIVGLTTWACAAAGIFGHSLYNGHSILLGFLMFVALVFNHVNACVTGVVIPFAMKRLGFDPAQSATIFATTFTDCGGFFATLWLAQMCMRWLK
jgi:magnesium transporter